MRAMIVAVILMMATVATGEPLMFEGKPSGQILASGARRVMILDQSGKVVWEHAGANMTDCWMLTWNKKVWIFLKQVFIMLRRSII